MAGLTVLLTSAAKSNPQILCKAKNLRLSRAPQPRPSPRAFLDQCFLCGRHLSHEEDIYMYRGDRAFCSEDCRWRQMAMDENDAGGETRTCSGRRARAAGNCVTARGGFAY